VAGGATVVLLAAVAWWWARGGDAPRALAYPVPGDRLKYTVEVLNGTDVDGLARAVTLRLRRRGVDVVYFGSAEGGPRDSTWIVVRRGDSSAALALRDLLGLGRIVVEPDPRLLLDLTLLLGTDAAALDRDP
jgi:hypothetical protein